ncbi:MAG: hypothetical protein M1335_03965, partial [Chloroflexi bacterium]|nr:hypothetical protein [Chloroflexota bacterium]
VLGAEKPVSSVAPRMFKHFWGYFDWLRLPLPARMYANYTLLSVASALGLVSAAVGSLNRVFAREGSGESKTRRAYPAQVGFLIVTVVLSLYALLAYNALLRGGGQGRYLFIAVTPIAVLFAAGLAWIQPVKFRALSLPLFLVALAALNMEALLYVILPYYY